MSGVTSVFENMASDFRYKAYLQAYEEATGYELDRDNPVLFVSASTAGYDCGVQTGMGAVWLWTNRADPEGRWWTLRYERGFLGMDLFTHWTPHKQRQQAKGWARAEAKAERAKLDRKK